MWLFVLIDRLGRRNLLPYGSVGGSVCFWIIGTSWGAPDHQIGDGKLTSLLGGYINSVDVAHNKSTTLTSGSGGIAAIFFFYLWTACYTPTWNGTPWVLNSEIFDQNTRSLGQASAAANNWFW